MTRKTTSLLILTQMFGATVALSHGDVAAQPVNTDVLPDVGKDWLIENPRRAMDTEVCQAAIEIGASGYNHTCPAF